VADVGVATRGVYGLDDVATGRAPLPDLGEPAGAATRLERPSDEGRCVGVCATDPGTVLGRLSDVEERLASIRRAGDAVSGASELMFLEDAFPDLPPSDVTCSGREVSTASSAGVSTNSCSAGDPCDADALFIVLPREPPCCDLLVEGVDVTFGEAVAGVPGLRMASLETVGGLMEACCWSCTGLEGSYGMYDVRL
jgi:hypothetical protein